MATETQGASSVNTFLNATGTFLPRTSFVGPRTRHSQIPFETTGPVNYSEFKSPSSGIALRGGDICEWLSESTETIELKFHRLSNEWKRDTKHLSTVSKIAAHPSYLKIVAIGEPAIPLILRDLEVEPNHWFTALHKIARQGPDIPIHIRGDIRNIANKWIEWGKKKNYIE